MLDKENTQSIESLEKGTNHLFRTVFERLNDLEQQIPAHSGKRKRIGLKVGTDGALFQSQFEPDHYDSKW